MATYKIHLAKQIKEGKVILSNTECGRQAYTRNGSVNVIYKTSDFKLTFENEKELCCTVCLERAKLQGRI